VLRHGLPPSATPSLPIAEREAIVLCISNGEHRKNHEVLLRTLRHQRALSIWFLGIDPENTARIAELAALAVPGRWRVLPPLTNNGVAELLGLCAVLAMPSRAEGFGLPVLEAMATGAVVLTTRHLAIPEVGGDAVAYSTTDPVELAGALARLLDNEGQRHDYAHRARARAASFRWESSAAAHRVAYRSAAALVPAATGPITLPVLAAEQKVVTQRAARTAVKQVPAGLDGENGPGH